MNKKFSTLVVSVLLAGAFVGTVDAQSKITFPIIPTPQEGASNALNGNVFYLSDQALGGIGGDVIKTYIKGQMNGGTTTEVVADPDNDRVDFKNEAYYQWVAVKVSTDGANDYYSFRNVATGKLYSGATAGTALSYKDVDLASYSGSAMSVFNIDTRALNADELNDMNQYAASFTMQFVDGADHTTPYTFVDNVFVGKKIVARDAGNAFFDYRPAAGEANATAVGANQKAVLTERTGTLLQVEGGWNGRDIYEAKHAYLETVAGTIVDVVYPVYDADQLAAFRASKFIILSNDQYSQFATDVDGDNSIKGYKFTIVTGAELLGKLTSVDVTLGNSKEYTYQKVETMYNGATGWTASTATVTLPTAGAQTMNRYKNDVELKTSVVRPFDNAIFNLYAKGTTAKACVNDIVIEMPVVYKHGVDNGDAYFQEYVWENTSNAADKTIEACVFDFEGQKYVCAATTASIQTHPTFVTNAFVEGMLVQPREFVAKKVVNVTYYAKQDEYGEWVNVDRNNDKVRRDDSWTWGPADTKDVLKQFVDFTVPEGQWLINYNANTNTYAFVNMESQEIIPTGITLDQLNDPTVNWIGFKLYDNGDDHYTATFDGNDHKRGTPDDWYDLYLTITAATEGDNLHGYTNFNDKQLENGFNIAVITDLMGNVYLKENHETSHKAAFDADKDNASVWRLQKYTAGKDYVKGIEVSDTIRIINPYSVWNARKAIFEVKADTIEALAYSIKNDLTGEYLKFNKDENAYYCDTKKYSDDEARTMAIDKFILKEKTINGKTGVNLIPAWIGNKLNEVGYDNAPISASEWWNKKLIGSFSENKLAQNIQKYRIVDNDLFAVTPVDAPVYITMNPAMDTVKIFKQDNNSEVLYEKSHFLGMEHLSDVPEMKAAMFVDTAYVRNETARPQYLLVVGAKHWEDNTICEIPGHPSHYSDTTSGRFLVNMVDSMYALGSTHNNPYKWDSYPKLAFINGIHTHDVLSLDTKDGVKNIDLSKNELNVATWAFRYVDRAAGSFIMEVGTHTGNGTIKTGYLKWLNGTPVVVNDIAMAEVLNMKETSEAPTANENVSVSEVSVVAVNGAVVVKGAAGKNVAISNILGQALVNTTIASDSETISVPAGIVVVAVEGEEAVKAVVK